MIMMTNLAIHTIAGPRQAAVPRLTKSLTKAPRVIYKGRRIEKFQRKGRKGKGRTKEIANAKSETFKEREGNLDIHKNRYYHQPKALVERIKSTFSNAVTRKRKKVISFSDSNFKNLRMKKFNYFIKKGEVYFKALPMSKARHLNHYTICLLEDKTCDATSIHVGICDLLSNVKSTNEICKGIIDIGLRCRTNNFGMMFISSIALSSKVNPASMQHSLLFDH